MNKIYRGAPRLMNYVCTALAAVIITFAACGCRASDSADKGYVDVHVHLWGSESSGLMHKSEAAPRVKPAPAAGTLFAQRKPGGPGNKPGPGKKTPGPGNKPGVQQGGKKQSSAEYYQISAENLLDKMDAAGVSMVLLMPPPRTYNNMDDVEVPALLDIARAHPDRFAVAAGGDILNPMIHDTPAGQVTDAIKKDFESKAQDLLDQGVSAFGEMAALHLSFSDHHEFEQVQPDHPLFLVLADVAARNNAAVDLHMEAVARDIPLPDGFSSKSSRNASTLKENIRGLENLLSHNRNARIVWQHIGWDNTGHMTPDLLRRLLTAHPNLFLALRVEDRLNTMGGGLMPNRIVDRNGNINPDWMSLFRDFQDRFVVGTDEFVGAPDSSGKTPKSFDSTWAMLDKLPDDLAAKIGGDNARRIYRLR